MVQCPHCRKAIPLALFTAHLGSLSKGKTSEAKKRSSRLNGLNGYAPGDLPSPSRRIGGVHPPA